MSDTPYQSDPVDALARDALLRFPSDRERAIDYVIRHGPATPQAAKQLIETALRNTKR